MDNAARGGHLDLVKFFFKEGAEDWYRVMGSAAEGGHKEVVEFFIKEDGDWDWDWAIEAALTNGEEDIAELLYLVKKIGRDNYLLAKRMSEEIGGLLFRFNYKKVLNSDFIIQVINEIGLEDFFIVHELFRRYQNLDWSKEDCGEDIQFILMMIFKRNY